jgi:hypothetical protein
VLDSSDIPTIVSHDFLNSALRFIRCADEECTAGLTTVTVFDSLSNEFGPENSMQLNGSEFPVVAFASFDGSENDLRLETCGDEFCSAGSSNIFALDSIGDYPSLQLDSSDDPVIAYYNATDITLEIGRSSGGTNTVSQPVTPGDITGRYASLQLDSSDFPVVTYYNVTNGDLEFMHCNDVACAGGGETFVTLDSVDDVGKFSSLQLDSAGRPVVIYFDTTNADIKLIRCDDVNCATYTTRTIIDNAHPTWGDTYSYSSLQLTPGTDFPQIVYTDVANDLYLLQCNDVSCGPPLPEPDPVFDPEDPEVSHGTSTSGSAWLRKKITRKPDTKPTMICPVFPEFLRPGNRDGNGVSTVGKLQGFLNKQGFIAGTTDGRFGPVTEGALRGWQLQNTNQVLRPWKIFAPTGLFLQLSRRLANIQEGCGAETVLLPDGTIVHGDGTITSP